jgi:hypothetical protein
VNGACHAARVAGQRGLQAHGGGIHHLLAGAAKARLQGHLPGRGIQALLRVVQHQLARRVQCAAQGLLRLQALEGLPAFGGQPQQRRVPAMEARALQAPRKRSPQAHWAGSARRRRASGESFSSSSCGSIFQMPGSASGCT